MGSAPTSQQLEGYASSHGWTFPVVSDPGYATIAQYVSGGALYLPTQSMLGPGLEVLMRDGNPSASMIESNLPE